MKTIGLLGGMSWESSIEYERLINTAVRDRLGGTHSADLIIRSYNFAMIEALQENDDWDTAGRVLASDAVHLQRAGAEAIVICTNTMHKVAETVQDAVDIPLVHIADATADAVIATGVTRVGVLGTRYTMEQDFYVDRLAARGILPVVPDEPDRTTIHDVIFEELVRGDIRDESKTEYLGVISRMIDRGAEGVIAGCTEIELLVTGNDVPVPFFPSTAIHAAAAVEFALS
ncbi:MAG: aspartate/glutamate racemase family protein [Acidimicrobiia bacterium]